MAEQQNPQQNSAQQPNGQQWQPYEPNPSQTPGNAQAQWQQAAGASGQQWQQPYAAQPENAQQPYSGQPGYGQQPYPGQGACPQQPFVEQYGPHVTHTPDGRKLVSKVAYVLLAFLVGGLGIHNFYAGKIGLGILYLLFFWTFIPAFAAFVQAIIALCKTSDAYGRIAI